jgi:hypothetical protein
MWIMTDEARMFNLDLIGDIHISRAKNSGKKEGDKGWKAPCIRGTVHQGGIVLLFRCTDEEDAQETMASIAEMFFESPSVGLVRVAVEEPVTEVPLPVVDGV